MPIRFTSLVSLFALVLAGGCSMREPNYCPGKNVHDNCLEPGDGPLRCTSNADCTPPEVCDVDGTQTCVQCTASDDRACTGTTPVCGDDRSCRPCESHAECDSRVCLPDGSCGDDVRVAYVDPAGTDNPACTSAVPCTRVFRALATGRPYVKLVGTTDEMVTVAGGQVVTFLGGPGTKLTTRLSGLGPILTVKDTGTSLRIYDLAIGDAPNAPTGIGIEIPFASGSASVTLVRTRVTNNPAGGIVMAGSGTLTVAQSVISKNTGGGISVKDGTFTIVGNVFFSNGTLTSTNGGMLISTMQSGNRLEFNSFYKNAAADGIGPAIHCVTGSAAARNNIMNDNREGTQFGGNCTHEYSIVRPGVLPSGRGNASVDPLFVDPLAGDLHIRADSPARRAADPSSSLTGFAARDIDGDVRTSPADIGADEVP